MSILALFVGLGGTSYAVAQLPKNSVGSKQIKKNAVTGSKVKNGSLKQGDFAAGQLPAGPQGAQGLPGAKGDKGAKGDTGNAGTFGAVTTVFFQAPADLANNANMSYGAFCPAGKI